MDDDTRGPRASRAKGKGLPPMAAEHALNTLAPTAEPPAKVRRKARPEPSPKPEKAKRGRKDTRDARVSMKLRVPKDLRKAFRQAAAAQDSKRGAFFARIFAEWQSRNPD